MLRILCARPKPWFFSALSYAHSAVQNRLAATLIPNKSFVNFVEDRRKRHHSSSCRLGSFRAASIWHAIQPSKSNCRNRNLRLSFHHEHKGEGSWNVASDVRPARWLHGSDSAWLLFGVCACLSPLDRFGGNLEAVVDGKGGSNDEEEEKRSEGEDKCSLEYRVTGVLADGRCLFRALAHCACLRNGEEAPDDNRQRELADDLRAQVVDELLKRRKESEWFIEGDFDAYVKSMKEPHEWGGEPELLMASHVLRTPIYVFMLLDRSSDKFVNVASYGEEYGKDEKSPIKVLFHGYGHYEVLETIK